MFSGDLRIFQDRSNTENKSYPQIRFSSVLLTPSLVYREKTLFFNVAKFSRRLAIALKKLAYFKTSLFWLIFFRRVAKTSPAKA